jgi:hypothetical protein
MSTFADRIVAARLSITPNLCLSGGATGADHAWGFAAKQKGHGLIHWSFPGEDKLSDIMDVVQLDDTILAEADPHLFKANVTMRRTYPPRGKRTRRLLQRNWFQVSYAESLYAVSSFTEKGQIEGGTAWAVTMFINRFNGAPCKAYVFDQTICRWFVWDGWWKPIYEPPRPAGIWAGIGRRAELLNAMGRLAINVALDYQPYVKTIWG